jgi:electron transfer flavoprotein beta subunit
VLKAAVQKGKYDLVLTGAQADDGAAQVGGMLAAMLDWPYASLVNRIEVDGSKLKVGREIEGGNQEMNEIALPCVLSIQTGINEPRYVGIRGIRKVASVEIPVHGAGDLGVDPATVGTAAAKVKRRLLHAPTGRGRRDPGRQHGRKDRQADRTLEGQRRVEIMAQMFAYVA